MIDEDWETLRTYEDVLSELNGDKPSDGNPLIAQAQKYGG